MSTESQRLPRHPTPESDEGRVGQINIPIGDYGGDASGGGGGGGGGGGQPFVCLDSGFGKSEKGR